MASLQDILAPLPPPPPPPPQTQPNHDIQALPPPHPHAETVEQQHSTPSHLPRDVRPTMQSAIFTPGIPGANATAHTANKMRHLKKEDGIPLWRKDIQYDFLHLVFGDKTRCFHKFNGGSDLCTFAEIYIEAMANSSKCSKILKEKLLTDGEGAISVAMVCLLVNLGRMNTTLNFFPEMRAQLRTYHSIPALQAHQDPTAYKQLQDAPRLKSILKGATEDEPQPATLEAIRAAPKPRTNVVNLIFVLSQFAPKVSDIHFDPPYDFHDLVMRPTLTSASRARAFLWLAWWYLESDFQPADAAANPFAIGNPTAPPEKVPPLDSLTEEQAELENVDTEEEKQYGETKRKERIAILASEPSPAMVAMKKARKDKPLALSDMRSEDEGSDAGWWKGAKKDKPHADAYAYGSRSPSPVDRAPRSFPDYSAPQDMRVQSMLNDDKASIPPPPPDAAPPPKKGPGRGNWRRNKPKPDTSTPTFGRTHADGHVPLLPNNVNPGDSNGPATPASGLYASYTSFPITNTISPDHGQPNHADHVPTPSYQAAKRGRGVTQHQSALMNHRRQQMEYLLDRNIRKIHASARRHRNRVSASASSGPMFRALRRLTRLPSGYDSEEELIKVRKARERERDGDHDAATKGPGATKAHGAGKGEPVDDERDGGPQSLCLASFADSSRIDVGEEALSLAQCLRRAKRRLKRWADEAPGDAMLKRQKQERLLALKPKKVIRERREEDEDVEMRDDMDD